MYTVVLIECNGSDKVGCYGSVYFEKLLGVTCQNHHVRTV